MRSSRFTLVELLIVIGIIAILAGILLPVISGAAKRADMTKAKAEITTLVNAIKQFESTYGHLPLPSHPSAYDEKNAFTGNQYRDLILMLQAEPRTPGSSDYNYPSFNSSNPNTRRTRFLDVVGNDPGEFSDPWGNNYYIHLDHNYDGRIGDPNLTNENDFPEIISGANDKKIGNVVYYSIVVWSTGALALDTTDKAVLNDNVYSFPIVWNKSEKKYEVGK
ncbi:MAG: prepilin-type N-terminal cleavage/methylation domain-containing protein [Lentisphaeria bacterium]|nr:prepilin-type N-terminal cleavage/methylation domain-containing protein [Lentisphaeria bacterium]